MRLCHYTFPSKPTNFVYFRVAMTRSGPSR